nr:hypothetical protein orf127a [Schizostauron trachyderma]
MHFILIGPAFFRSISQGWLTYFQKSSGPKFTEEQIRMADHAAGVLDDCYPISDLIGTETHHGICKSLKQQDFLMASRCLERELPPLTKANCFEALKVGVWLLGCTAPNSIRCATFNLLACEYFFSGI